MNGLLQGEDLKTYLLNRDQIVNRNSKVFSDDLINLIST